MASHVQTILACTEAETAHHGYCRKFSASPVWKSGMHESQACQGSRDLGGWNSRLAIGLHVSWFERWYAIAWVDAGQGTQQAS